MRVFRRIWRWIMETDVAIYYGHIGGVPFLNVKFLHRNDPTF
jgi:hypothetical protein